MPRSPDPLLHADGGHRARLCLRTDLHEHRSRLHGQASRISPWHSQASAAPNVDDFRKRPAIAEIANIFGLWTCEMEPLGLSMTLLATA